MGTQIFQSVRPAEFYSAEGFRAGKLVPRRLRAGWLPGAAGLETRWAHRPEARVSLPDIRSALTGSRAARLIW